jgi:hypothetical protein
MHTFEPNTDPIDANAPASQTLEAPAAGATFSQRETWCDSYVRRLIAETPDREPLPLDLRPTHLFETEFNSCTLDPREYERETLGAVEDAK